VIVVVRQRLEGDQQPEQLQVTAIREDPEECSTVEERALVGQRLERLLSMDRV
jgi:hypothetical protein